MVELDGIVSKELGGGGNIGGMGKKIFEISMMVMEITDAQLWNE